MSYFIIFLQGLYFIEHVDTLLNKLSPSCEKQNRSAEGLSKLKSPAKKTSAGGKLLQIARTLVLNLTDIVGKAVNNR